MSDVETVCLSRGMEAKIDKADSDNIAAHKWSALKASGNGARAPKFYAARTVVIDGKQKTILMHREVVGAGQGEVVDHIDGNTLNNRRSNLRRCTNRQNSLNSGAHKRANRTSQFKGVCWDRGCGKWRVGFRGKYIGVFDSEIEAAKAYDRVAAAFDPDFARLNFTIGGDNL